MTPPKTSSPADVLYAAHRDALVDYANGIVRDRSRAEDVVQDAWMRVAAAERTRALIEPLRYFYRVVRNLALDYHRVQRREGLREGGDLTVLAERISDVKPSPEAAFLAREELRLVLECLDELPERVRRAVLLYKVEGLKLREIAARMDISIASANSLVLDGVAHCAARVPRRR